MSNIEQYLADILAARYGEEVRQSIHDAIQQCYEDGRAGAIDLEARADIAAETTAREALDTRVNGIDTRVETLENDTTTAEEVTYDDTSTQLGATNVQGAIGALNNNLTNGINGIEQDLNGLFCLISPTYPEVVLAADTSSAVTPSAFPVPTGYTPVAFAEISTVSPIVTAYRQSISNGRLYLRSHGAAATITPLASVLCVKTDFLQQ